MSANILSYTQHLQGIGHLVRSLRIAEAAARAGFGIDLAVGGVFVDGLSAKGVNLVKLPPVKAGPGGYSDLRDQHGRQIDDGYRDKRSGILRNLLDNSKPDIVMIEAFPFGRRQMRFELLPLLEAAMRQSPRPLIVCSVRDILQENKKPKRLVETVDILNQYFDLVLVHGDEEFAPLELSFAHARDIAVPIVHTGLVAGPGPGVDSVDKYDVIVSAGGGAMGETILANALKARPLCGLHDARWCVITGPNLSEAAFEELGHGLPDNVELHRFKPNLAGLMTNARLSISQCGYNTAIDIFQTRCPAVLVPYSREQQTEQTRRAHLMAGRDFAIVVDEPDLTPKALARAIDRAGKLPNSDHDRLPGLGGADRSVEILQTALEGRG